VSYPLEASTHLEDNVSFEASPRDINIGVGYDITDAAHHSILRHAEKRMHAPLESMGGRMPAWLKASGQIAARASTRA
jgi:hypothetical protein